MEETFLPWWLVLLLGMWATALTFWRHPRVNREVRLWAGLLTLVYLALIFLALRAGSTLSTSAVTKASAHTVTLTNLGFVACGLISLTTIVVTLGRISSGSRQLSYVVFTLANSGIAALYHCPEVAFGLLVVAMSSAVPLISQWSRRTTKLSLRKWFIEQTRFLPAPIADDNSGEVWLVGILSGVLACVLLGTISFAMRVETSRAISSPRYTELPSRGNLERLHANREGSNPQPSLFDRAFGVRAEIVVLLAVIVFLCLAITPNDVPGHYESKSNSSPSVLPEPGSATRSEVNV